MIKGIFIGLIGAIIVLLITVAVFTTGVVSQEKTYSAVYMETGDLYFGELHTFPFLYLTNVWYLQGGAGAGVTVSQFTESLWGPTDKMRLNRDKIVWTTTIASTSQLINILKGQVAPEQSFQAPSLQGPTQGPPTATEE